MTAGPRPDASLENDSGAGLAGKQKYAPQARVIVLVDKGERVHVDKLNDILPLAGVLTHPVTAAELEILLDADHGPDASPA